MKQKLSLPTLIFMVMMTFSLSSCTEEKAQLSFPLSAEIFKSIVDKQVAFTALTHSAVSWAWDFGDGKSSTEKNPVHVYAEGGYYKATLTAKDATGASVVKEVKLAIALTQYALLTGDHTDPNYKGKTWKLSADHSTHGDYLATADLNLTTMDPDITPLPTGAFGLYLGLGEVYDDTYTFFFDGKFGHDLKADKAAFGGIVHQLKTNGGAGIVKMSSISDFPLCTAKYTPETGATFTYVAKEDLSVASAYGPPNYVVTYKGVSTLNFSGTEFLGFMDKQRKVIVQQITDRTMKVVMFAALHPTYYPLNTTALVLSFEVVD
jgi:PKD repeat protein